MDESTRWMAALNTTLRNDLVGSGGNIILSQIENEWNPASNCMQHTGPDSWTDQDDAGVNFYLCTWLLLILHLSARALLCLLSLDGLVTQGTGSSSSRCDGAYLGCGTRASHLRSC